MKLRSRGRILIAPRPGFSGGPAIALLRLERALRQQGFATTSRLFRMFGATPLPWQLAIMMGVPAHAQRLLQSRKPVILIMGKPEDPLESAAVDRTFSTQDEIDNETRAAAIEAADHTAFISNYVAGIWRDWFARRGRAFPSAERWSVVYHGLDLQQFAPPPHRIASEPFVIGSIGAMRTRVRVDAIYEISKRLTFPHRWTIVGSMTDECEQRFAELKSQADFEWKLDRRSWVAADELTGMLQSLDCLMHPVDYEGFGIVIAEAMACGVPVVAPRQGGAGEIVGDGGVLAPTVQFRYDQTFFDELARGVEAVRQNRDAFSARARATALRQFDIHQIAQQYLDIGTRLGAAL